MVFPYSCWYFIIYSYMAIILTLMLIRLCVLFLKVYTGCHIWWKDMARVSSWPWWIYTCWCALLCNWYVVMIIFIYFYFSFSLFGWRPNLAYTIACQCLCISTIFCMLQILWYKLHIWQGNKIFKSVPMYIYLTSGMYPKIMTFLFFQ